MIPRTMSVEEAAGHFHVLPCTIRTWIRSGRLPAKKIGKQYYIPEREVEKMLLEDKPGTTTRLSQPSREEQVMNL